MQALRRWRPRAGASRRRDAHAVLALACAAAAITAASAHPLPCRAQHGADRGPPAAWPELEVQRCPPGWNDGLRRLLQIELAGGDGERPAGAIAVEVRCNRDLVDIAVSASGTGNGTQRRMDLSTTAPSVRTRVLALAIAGLVRELALIARPHGDQDAEHDDEVAPAGGAAPARSAQPEPEPEPEARPPARPAPEPAAPDDEPAEDEPDDEQAAEDSPAETERATDEPPAEPPSDQPAALQVDLLVIAGNFAASGDLLWSGGARVHYLPLAPLRVALDVQAGTYARDAELGSVRLFAGSLGARAGWMLARRPLGLSAGGGQRVGIARASATAGDGRARDGVVQGAWAAPFAFLTLEAAVGERLRLGVDAEIGAVLLPVRGRVESGDDIAVDGLWAALAIALGAQF